MKTYTPYEAVSFIVTGEGDFSITGKQARYTYRLAHNKERTLTWVRCTAVDNEPCDIYLGYVWTRGGALTRLTESKWGNAGHPAYVALDWYIRKALTEPEVAKQCTFNTGHRTMPKLYFIGGPAHGNIITIPGGDIPRVYNIPTAGTGIVPYKIIPFVELDRSVTLVAREFNDHRPIMRSILEEVSQFQKSLKAHPYLKDILEHHCG